LIILLLQVAVVVVLQVAKTQVAEVQVVLEPLLLSLLVHHLL
jgi:hypothetical protein